MKSELSGRPPQEQRSVLLWDSGAWEAVTMGFRLVSVARLSKYKYRMPIELEFQINREVFSVSTRCATFETNLH